MCDEFCNVQAQVMMYKYYLILYVHADSSGKQHPVVTVAYKFDGVAEHKVLVRPHGQSSKQKAFYRTAASVKTQLSKALVSNSPKDALDKVLQDKGGLLGAASAGQMPRNRQQVIG